MKCRIQTVAVVGLMLALSGAASVHAQSRWNNTLGDGNINNAANWSAGLPNDAAGIGALVAATPLVINQAFNNGGDNRSEYLITGSGGVTVAAGGSFTYFGDGLIGSTAFSAGGASTITQTGGTLIQDGGGTGFLIGHNARGTYNISGGNLYVLPTCATLTIRYTTGSDGSSLNISGTGRVDVEAGVNLVINAGGTLNVTGGGLLVWHNRTVGVDSPGAGTINAAVTQVGSDVHFTDPTAPAVTITNPASDSVTVDNSVTVTNISGTSWNVVGTMSWTNSQTTSNGTIEATATWSISGIDLDEGANVITVTGTNAAGTEASASVTITRQAPDAPTVSITDPSGNVTVDNSVTSTNISGTGANLAGDVSWTNDLTGAFGTATAGATWVINGIALSVGANDITVTGTNATGAATNDSVTITRQAPLITNGDFESGSGLGRVSAGANWTSWVETDTQGWIEGTTYGVHIADTGDSGINVVNLARLGAAIEQEIATEIGKTYTITYGLGAMGGSSSPAYAETITVSADGGVVATQVVSHTAAASGTFVNGFTADFVATEALTTIRFENTADGVAGDYGAVLDNVSVIEAVTAPRGTVVFVR